MDEDAYAIRAIIASAGLLRWSVIAFFEDFLAVWRRVGICPWCVKMPKSPRGFWDS